MTDTIPNDVLDVVERQARTLMETRRMTESMAGDAILRLVAHYRASAPVPASVPDFEAWARRTYETPAGVGGVWNKPALLVRIATELRAAWEHREP